MAAAELTRAEVEILAARLYETLHEGLYVEPWEALADYRRHKYRRAVARHERERASLLDRRETRPWEEDAVGPDF